MILTQLQGLTTGVTIVLLLFLGRLGFDCYVFWHLWGFWSYDDVPIFCTLLKTMWRSYLQVKENTLLGGDGSGGGR